MTENKKEVKGFYFYCSQMDALFNLPPESAMNALKMCRAYIVGDEPTSDDPIAVCTFGLMRPALDMSMKRAESGSKGGKANGKQNEANESKPEANASKTKQNEANGKQSEAKEQIKKNKEQDINTKTCSHPEAGGEPVEPAVFVLPTNKGEEYPIHRTDVDRWREIYPAVNVEQEIRNMIGWCEGHKSQRKTWGGMAKFITGWLAREQDRGPSIRASPPISSAPRWNQPVN